MTFHGAVAVLISALLCGSAFGFVPLRGFGIRVEVETRRSAAVPAPEPVSGPTEPLPGPTDGLPGSAAIAAPRRRVLLASAVFAALSPPAAHAAARSRRDIISAGLLGREQVVKLQRSHQSGDPAARAKCKVLLLSSTMQVLEDEASVGVYSRTALSHSRAALDMLRLIVEYDGWDALNRDKLTSTLAMRMAAAPSTAAVDVSMALRTAADEMDLFVGSFPADEIAAAREYLGLEGRL